MAKFHWVHSDGAANIVCVCFHCKGSLRGTVAAHCTCAGRVGQYGIQICYRRISTVHHFEGAGTFAGDRVPMVAVRAFVCVSCHFAGGDGAVGSNVTDQMEEQLMAYAGVLEILLAAQAEVDTSTGYLRAEKGGQRFIERILLVAEAATNARLYDANTAPGNPQGLADNTPQGMGCLCRGIDDQVAVFLVGKCGCTL